MTIQSVGAFKSAPFPIDNLLTVVGCLSSSAVAEAHYGLVQLGD